MGLSVSLQPGIQKINEKPVFTFTVCILLQNQNNKETKYKCPKSDRKITGMGMRLRSMMVCATRHALPLIGKAYKNKLSIVIKMLSFLITEILKM